MVRVETKSGNFLGVYGKKRDFIAELKYRPNVKLEDCIFKRVRESKKKEHIVYSSYYDSVFYKGAEEDVRERLMEDGWELEDITEDRIADILYEDNSIWFDDEKIMLEGLKGYNGIIAIADLGLWNGRRVGYKEYDALEDIMYSSCDYEKIYVDGYGNLRKEESHHDGNNSILYRQWKDGTTDAQRERFLDKCYNGTLKDADISRYTDKLGHLIAEVYGW